MKIEYRRQQISEQENGDLGGPPIKPPPEPSPLDPESSIFNLQSSIFKAIAIGASAGGYEALNELFSHLSDRFPLPVVVAQHVHATQDGSFTEHFDRRCALRVKEADEKEAIEPGHIYFAPPNYHLLIERDETFSLSIDAKVNYSRPSIDVLFESAAYAWSSRLIGILLTGASSDGARGMRAIRDRGGLTIAQKPQTAKYPVMPQSAIDTGAVDRVMTLGEIGELLTTLRVDL